MLKRFSISLEDNLLDKFDNYISQRSYENRSEAIRDLIRNSFISQDWENDNDVIGVVSLVYDHHKHQIQEKITDLQHNFYAQIISTTHIHIDHDNCLEVIIVRGKAKKIYQLADSLKSLRGVKHGNLSMTSTGDALD